MTPPPPELPPMKPMAPPPPGERPAPLPAGPVKPMGPRRLRQIVTMIAGGGLALVLLIVALELIARPGLRPSDLLATIEARTERGIFNQKMGEEPGVLRLTEADYQRAIAQAQREGQTRAELDFQRRLSAVQADRERVVGAYQTLYQRTNMIAQAALQLETLAQQMRARLLETSNGGRNVVIAVKDIFCGLGDANACRSARSDRGTMIAEADELARGDVGTRIRGLLSGIEDPAALVADEDRRRNGAPGIDRR